MSEETTLELEEETPVEEVTPELDHTLLELWQGVLAGVDTEQGADMPPSAAMQLVERWPFLRIQDTLAVQELYYRHLAEIRDILTAEILSDDKCLGRVETDAEDNREHYLNVVARWQNYLRNAEREWSSIAEDAHITLPATVLATDFALSSMGLIAHLDVIGVDFGVAEVMERARKLEESGE